MPLLKVEIRADEPSLVTVIDGGDGAQRVRDIG